MTDPNGQAITGNLLDAVGTAVHPLSSNSQVSTAPGGGVASDLPMRASHDDEHENFSPPKKGDTNSGRTDKVGHVEKAAQDLVYDPGHTLNSPTMGVSTPVSPSANHESASADITMTDVGSGSGKIVSLRTSKPWAETLRPSNTIGRSPPVAQTEHKFDKMTLEEARQHYDWIGHLQISDISQNKALPFFTFMWAKHGYWTMDQQRWLSRNVSREFFEQIEWEKIVDSYFQEIHYPARRKAFELLTKMPKVEAIKLIALKTVEDLGDIVIKEIDTCEQDLSPVEGVSAIKAWFASILPKKEAELAAIAKVIKDFDKAVFDTPMQEDDNTNQTFGSATLNAEQTRLLKTALRLRLEVWLLNHHQVFVSPQSGLIHVHCPTWNLTTDTSYSSIPVMNAPAIIDGYLNHVSLPFTPNSKQRSVFEALIDSFKIEGDSASSRRFETLRNPSQFVSFKISINTNYLQYADSAMKAHFHQLPRTPEFFFTDTEIPEKDPFLAYKNGFIRIEDGIVPVNMTSSHVLYRSTLTIQEYVKYCSNCFLTDHTRYACPKAYCVRCNREGHWSKSCQAGKRAQPQQAISPSVTSNAPNNVQTTGHMNVSTKNTDPAQAKSNSNEWQKVGSNVKQNSPRKKGNGIATSKPPMQKNPYSLFETTDQEEGNAGNNGDKLSSTPSKPLMATLGDYLNPHLQVSRDKNHKVSLAKKNTSTGIPPTYPHGEAATASSTPVTSKSISKTLSTNATSTSSTKINRHDTNCDRPQITANETQSAMELSFNGEDIANSTHMNADQEIGDFSYTLGGQSENMETTEIGREPDQIEKSGSTPEEEDESDEVEGEEEGSEMLEEGNSDIFYDMSDSSSDEEEGAFDCSFLDDTEDEIRPIQFEVSTKDARRITRNTPVTAFRADFNGTKYAMALSNPTTNVFSREENARKHVEKHSVKWKATPKNYQEACMIRGRKRVEKIAMERANRTSSSS
ncbi:hypothetical protein OY671_004268 [Metschnikowia pulcherrima]|nr:hypothetical protein OY671_004268 [Metschnikowia pulcherrima]